MEAAGKKPSKSAQKAAAKEKAESGAPKKPLGTYFCYLREQREIIKKDQPDLSMC